MGGRRIPGAAMRLPSVTWSLPAMGVAAAAAAAAATLAKPAELLALEATVEQPLQAALVVVSRSLSSVGHFQ